MPWEKGGRAGPFLGSVLQDLAPQHREGSLHDAVMQSQVSEQKPKATGTETAGKKGNTAGLRTMVLGALAVVTHRIRHRQTSWSLQHPRGTNILEHGLQKLVT